MKCAWGRAFAGALTLLSISATAAEADPANPAPSAAPGSPAAAQPAPAVMLPPTGDASELPALPPVYQSIPPSRADAPATSPPVPRGPYVHDGVFFRLSVGPGLFQGSSGNSPDFRTFTAGAVAIDAAIGGSPGRGFILGAAFQTNRFFSLSSSDDIDDGDEPNLSDVSLSVSGLGMFADYYPEPTDGLHFLAAIGIGWLDVSRSNDSSERNPSGVLLGLGGGYEWFVGPNVSLGVLLRGNLGLFSVNESGTSASSTNVTVFIPALLVTATYN